MPLPLLPLQILWINLVTDGLPGHALAMEKAERVTRFQRHTLHSFREMVIAMGLDNPWQIAPHLMSERINGVQSDSFEHLYRFLEPGELLDSPESTPYAKAWAAARADTFREVA